MTRSSKMPSSLMVIRPIAVLAVVAAAAFSGCSLCCNTYDYFYPTFGGKWQRADPVHGRVGSLFDDASGGMIGGYVDSEFPLHMHGMESFAPGQWQEQPYYEHEQSPNWQNWVEPLPEPLPMDPSTMRRLPGGQTPGANFSRPQGHRHAHTLARPASTAPRAPRTLLPLR